jgi:undecaprenyl diphosphate synthase
MTDSTQNQVPRHIGFILDGHRRWAKEHNIPLLEGHRQGYKNFKKIGLAALDRGVECVSAYVWSKENWQRSAEEVSYIMRLLLWVAEHQLEDIHAKGVRVEFLGNDEKLDPKILEAIEKAREKTANNTNGTLALCLNYGGQQEIVDATKSLISSGADPESITPETFAEHLYAPSVPALDLLIRSSGEQRISGFMLWRAAYAELMFIDKKWPDFTEADLDAALTEFSARQRRFGK